MKSQPMAASVEGGRLYVFAYARNHTIRYKMYEDGKWEDGWLEVGKSATSAPYVRTCGSAELHVTVKGVGRECQKVWKSSPQSAWSGWDNHGGGLSSSPVLWCSPDLSLYRPSVLGFNGLGHHYTIERGWVGGLTGPRFSLYSSCALLDDYRRQLLPISRFGKADEGAERAHVTQIPSPCTSTSRSLSGASSIMYRRQIVSLCFIHSASECCEPVFLVRELIIAATTMGLR